MTGTRQLGSSAAPALSSGLGWYRVLRLGLLGLASDMRDRQREPALRKHPSVCALDPRLHRPVFIIGAPRSGTSFLGSCLGRMPEISYHFEPRLTKAAAQYVYDGTWSERRCAILFRASYRALVLAALDGGRRFADKNPENSFLIPFLAATFPAAQFVHIIRDGRDAAVSHAEKPWLTGASAGSGLVGHAGQSFGPHARWWVEPGRREEFATVPDIVRTAWCWRRFTESALDGLAALPPWRVVEVRYEEVVTVPMTAADVLGKFLGTSPVGLEALRGGLAGAKPDSVGRWRRELSETQVAEVEHEIGPLLTKLGYS